MANADTLDGAGVNSGNALDAAKIQLNSETMKFYTDTYPIPGGLHQVTVHAPWPPSPHANYFSNKKIEKQRDFKAPQALSGDTELTARAANVLNSAAKVQLNSDISKENQEKIREQRILGNNMYGYVSDMNGMPLMVYHGTAIGLNRFEEYREDKPIWFTPDRDYADIYANRTERNIYRSDIRPSYIKIKYQNTIYCIMVLW